MQNETKPLTAHELAQLLMLRAAIEQEVLADALNPGGLLIPHAEFPLLEAFRASIRTDVFLAFAERLQGEFRPGATLLSSEELANCLTSATNRALLKHGLTIDKKSREALERFATSIGQRSQESSRFLVLPGRDAHTEHHRWVNIVLKLASERRTTRDRLLLDRDSSDEVLRRFYTKDEYLAAFNELMRIATDHDTIMENQIRPLLGLLESDRHDPDQRAKITQSVIEVISGIIKDNLAQIAMTTHDKLAAIRDATVKRVYDGS